jgi:hypothetical protein
MHDGCGRVFEAVDVCSFCRLHDVCDIYRPDERHDFVVGECKWKNLLKIYWFM